jgi:anaerobic selenocysteine-containing dehydrogenase
MNGLIREILTHGWIDDDYAAAHAVNIDALRSTVDRWTPEAVADVCRVPAHVVRRAAELFGTSDAVLSTVLQSFVNRIRPPRRPAW